MEGGATQSGASEVEQDDERRRVTSTVDVEPCRVLLESQSQV